MVRRVHPALLGVLAASMLTGCGEEFSNDLFLEDLAFATAVPTAQALEVRGGSVDTVVSPLSRTIGETSEMYTHTREMSLLIDRRILWHLRDLERVVQSSPDLREPDRRVWGPNRHPLDPMESRLVVTRSQGLYTYAYELRRARSDDQWTQFISGWYEPESDGSPGGSGAITFELDALAMAKGQPGEGLAHFDYLFTGAGSRVWFSTRGLVDQEGGVQADVDAYYERGDSQGMLQWTSSQEEGEQIEVVSRWLPTGAGRSDLQWRPTPTGSATYVTECWDPSFALIYSLIVKGVFIDAEGDPAACPFDDFLAPDQVRAGPADPR